MATEDLGLRARKLARTRDQIAEAAVQLFIERGYDATTLEDVAERADIHKRTLLRYFPTKAHLVLHGQYRALDEFRIAIAQRGQRPIVEVWRGHVVHYAQSLAKRGPSANLRKIAHSEPTLEGAYLSIQAQYQAMLYEGLVKDLEGRPDSEILAHVASSALAGGNYAVFAMIFSREAYDELEAAELQVIEFVRKGLLSD